MASTKERLDSVLARLAHLEGVTYKTMMREYIIYYHGKNVGGVYDDRFLVKNTNTSRRLLPDAPLEQPYDGANEMLRVGDGVDGELLAELFNGMFPELPAPKKKA